MHQSSLSNACMEPSSPLLVRSLFMPIHEDVALANHATIFSHSMVELFVFSQVAYLFGLYSFVRGTFPCEGIHILCCFESVEEKCLEQDRAPSKPATGWKTVATETSVLQATGWCGRWCVETWGFLLLLFWDFYFFFFFAFVCVSQLHKIK